MTTTTAQATQVYQLLINATPQRVWEAITSPEFTTKYFHGLEDGEIPFLLLFSGTMFLQGETGFSVEQVPWDKEATYRLPVATWREAMDSIFPDAAWIRLRRDNLDALARFKSRLALPTWDDALEALLAERVTDE